MTTHRPTDTYRSASARSLANWWATEGETGNLLGNQRRDRLCALLEIEIALQAADQRHKDLQENFERYVKAGVLNTMRSGPCQRTAEDDEAPIGELVEGIADNISALENLCLKILLAEKAIAGEDALRPAPKNVGASHRRAPAKLLFKRHARAA